MRWREILLRRRENCHRLAYCTTEAHWELDSCRWACRKIRHLTDRRIHPRRSRTQMDGARSAGSCQDGGDMLSSRLTSARSYRIPDGPVDRWVSKLAETAAQAR